MCLGQVTYAAAAQPIVTDSRIKTYVYNENEVYSMLIYFGYQSSIEFGLNEEVQTISIGDSYAWKVTPVGRRLFIKPLEENIHTNMTIITNKRTYQFDVISRTSDASVNQELVYVVRFFYPDKKAR
jgi:type IV secretion system protein VirB9